MHVFIRSSSFVKPHYKLLKSSHSYQALKCLCSEIKEGKRHHSTILFRLGVPPEYIHGASIDNLRVNNGFPHPKNLTIRTLYLSPPSLDKEPLKPSSKVEAAVQEIKKQKEELPAAAATSKVVVKKSLGKRIVDELVHYYHGFRLLFIDIKISSVLAWRVLKGHTLTRREHRLLIRTVSDMFRLVPFSVFIIVPFMEFLLPVFIKLFPNMLPSTFQTATEKEDKIKKNLKIKLEMAKFLQQTLDDMSLQHKDHNSKQAKEFSEWFQKVRTSGEFVTNEEIMKYSKLFEDEITLDSLSRSQLVALCRVLEVQTLGTTNLLRFQLRMKLRSLAADDKMIQKEGVDSLTLHEVQQACRARGMRAYGVSEARLRSQLQQWLDLSLNDKVPPSLLLLSRALMLPETIPTHDKLLATISALPETVKAQTEVAIAEKEGKVDHKVKIQMLKEEEKKVKEERLESKEEKKKDILVDTAPKLADKAETMVDSAKVISVAQEKPLVDKADQHLQAQDLAAIEHALDNIAKDTKKLVVEKEVIQELKEEMADYQEDVQDLKKVVADEAKPAIQESKAAQRLFKKVNKMITKLDKVVEDLEDKGHQLKKDLESVGETDIKKQELLQIDDILAAIRKIKDVPDDSRMAHIKNVLGKIDDDMDGSVKVEDVLKVIEFIGKENVQLTPKQVDELIELLDKEEILEVEGKIEKALQKEKQTQDEAKLSTSKEEPSKPQGEKEPQAPVSKPKVEAQTNIISPPISSIDSTKSKDTTSKML